MGRVVYLSGLVPDVPEERAVPTHRVTPRGRAGAPGELRATPVDAGRRRDRGRLDVVRDHPADRVRPCWCSRCPPGCAPTSSRSRSPTSYACSRTRSRTTPPATSTSPAPTSSATPTCSRCTPTWRTSPASRSPCTAPRSSAVALTAGLVSAAPYWTAAALVRSLQHDMVCRPGQPDPSQGRPHRRPAAAGGDGGGRPRRRPPGPRLRPGRERPGLGAVVVGRAGDPRHPAAGLDAAQLRASTSPSTGSVARSASSAACTEKRTDKSITNPPDRSLTCRCSLWTATAGSRSSRGCVTPNPVRRPMPDLRLPRRPNSSGHAEATSTTRRTRTAAPEAAPCPKNTTSASDVPFRSASVCTGPANPFLCRTRIAGRCLLFPLRHANIPSFGRRSSDARAAGQASDLMIQGVGTQCLTPVG